MFLRRVEEEEEGEDEYWNVHVCQNSIELLTFGFALILALPCHQIWRVNVYAIILINILLYSFYFFLFGSILLYGLDTNK